MADENQDPDQRVKRSVRRTLTGATLFLVVVGGLVAWGSFGAFTLKPGQAAVLLFLGAHDETITTDGFHLRLPPPLVKRTLVNYAELHNIDFGFRGKEDASTPTEKLEEATMQTSDNNVVRVSFAVQYKIKDPFFYRYKIADPEQVVRDAAQAAMREVVGRNTVDGVLRDKRALVASEAEKTLQDTLDSYESGILIDSVQLQDVQPPEAVRAAFDDVVNANQDKSRLVNEAEGYRNELIPKARAQAAELVAEAGGYRDAKIAEAKGEAERFEALYAEYRKAPEVTRTRLYLETMEEVLPNVEKVIIEPGTTQVLPYLPLRGGDAGPSR
ncbi:MAG: FtsH protease activity modulator HflK [Myxococcota bacterium]|nr:FtsH protease activity modulator HflK [Myxococcota bacterium]